MIPVALNQPFKLVDVFITTVKQAIFIQNQHPKAVAGIQEFRVGGLWLAAC
jgi:hypothetical protein